MAAQSVPVLNLLLAIQVSFVAKRGTQEDEQPDTTIVVDLEKYSIPDGTRYIRGITVGHDNVLYLDPFNLKGLGHAVFR